MNAGFLNIWKVYRRGLRHPAFAGEAPRGDAAFDSEVRVGEIRIFADGNRPLMALIVADCGLSGRRIVPVSPFSAPASARELVIGDRIFQLWNTTRASRRFTDRSWRVDTLSAAELARVQAAIAAAQPGRLTAGDSSQARYEREFLISAGNFIPLVESHTVSSMGRWLFNGWCVAASMVVCLGAFCLMFSPGDGRLSAVWNEVAFRVAEDDDSEIIELIEPEAVEVEGGDLTYDQIRRENTPQNSIPSLPQPKSIVAVVKPDLSPVHAGGPAPGSARGQRMPQNGYTSPRQLSVLLAGGKTKAEGAVSVEGDIAAYSASRAPKIAQAGKVNCVVTECPWNMSHRLLNVRAATAQGLTIEVGFDPKAVGSYRLISNAGVDSINAFYEIVPNGLSGFPPESLSITTRWQDAQGEQMRLETVRTGRVTELHDLPQIPRKAADATGAISPDDVPVKVDL